MKKRKAKKKTKNRRRNAVCPFSCLNEKERETNEKHGC
jgi:hypothetical protein